MNKKDLVEDFWVRVRMNGRSAKSRRRPHISRPQADAILNAVFQTIGEALERGEEVPIPRFGKFSIKKFEDGATVINPLTRERVARRPDQMRTIRFKPSQVMVRRVNQGEKVPS